MKTLFCLMALLCAVSVNGQSCAKDIYQKANMTYVGPPVKGADKKASAGYEIPFDCADVVNDSTIRIYHPDLKNPCKEVSDTLTDVHHKMRSLIQLMCLDRKRLSRYSIVIVNINETGWQIIDTTLPDPETYK